MADQQQGDSSSDVIYLTFFVCVIVGVIFYYAGDTILAAHLFLRKMWLVMAMTITGGGTLNLDFIRQAMAGSDPADWTLERLGALSGGLRWYILGVLIPIFSGFSYWVYRKNPAPRLKRIHSMETLNTAQVHEWPWIAPVMGKNVIDEPIEKGPWAMSSRPVDFAKRYRLLDGKILNKGRAEKLFAMQLGRLWEGPERLPAHVRALYACFIAQLCRDVSGARAGLKELSFGMTSGNFKYEITDALLAKHGKDERVLDVMKYHAYVATVMCGTLERCRKYGVLAPNHFLWLRPKNRPMWYALQNIGRRTPFVEVAGVQAHFLAEEVAGHAIERPYVIEAVEALEKALNEVRFE